MPKLRGDERALRRTISNLLSNAVKFTASGGHVRIALKGDPDQGLSIAITDTGIGMEMAEVPRLLQPFAQGAEDLARKYEGGGLGLSVAKSLVELHDGSLEIRSKLGVGTSVTLHLPPHRLIGHVTDDETVLGLEPEAAADFGSRLILEYDSTAASVFEGSGNCLLGRNREKPNEVRCDIVVDDRRVSRPHARVRRESDGFFLFDLSQRGTHVVPEDGSPILVRHEAPLRLESRGRIYLGVDPASADIQPIVYRLEAGEGA